MAKRVYTALPSKDQIQALLTYEPETGLFRWKETRRYRRAGAIAGGLNNGYVRIGLLGGTFFAHRLAYVVMTGEDLTSADEIDHINLIKTDNRWVNLRLSTRSANVHNAPPSKLNQSGHRGVQWRPYNRKWIAKITVDNRIYHLGTFQTKDEALRVRLEAEERFGLRGMINGLCNANGN